MRKANWVFVIATGVFLGLCACVVVGIGFITLPRVLPKPTYEVKYYAFGYGTITYINESGGTEQIKEPSGMWRKIFTAKSGEFVSVTVQSDQRNPSAKCYIYVDNIEVKSSVSGVAYGIATCSYILP